MQKILFSLLLLLSADVFSQNKVTIYGTIEKAGPESVTITNDKYFLGKKQEVHAAPVNDGKYSATFEIDHNRIVTLNYKDQSLKLYVEPGDSISLFLQGNAVPQIAGKGAVHNQFLFKFEASFKDDFNKTVMAGKITTNAVDAFEMMIFSTRKKQQDFYNEYPEKKLFSPAFKNYVENAIKYNYWNYLLAYPIVNANNNKGLTVTPLPAVMLDGFNKSAASNDSALICESYRNFLTYYVTYFTSEANDFNKFTDYSLSMQRKYYLANQHLKNESFRYFIAKYLFDECEKASAETVKKIYNVLAWADNNGGYSKIVNEKCGAAMNAKEPAAAGSAVPALKMKDLKGKDRTFADFKGKVLYVDFWASWCGPCRQQFPFAKELMTRLNEKQKKQIEFLYISIDDTDELWKGGIAANQLEGFQLHSPGGWKSEVVKYFKINSIPRYMLIDKKGNIVDPNAKRPSQPEVLDEILKLL